MVDFLPCVFIIKSEPKHGQVRFANTINLQFIFLRSSCIFLMVVVYKTKAMVLYQLLFSPHVETVIVL